MSTLKKLKIIGNVTIYSTANSWHIYRDIISVIKAAVLNSEIKVLNVKYKDDFDEKYHPYTKENNWGGNLDEFTLQLDSEMNCVFKYYSINDYSRFFNRQFKFELEFKLPKKFLKLFESEINRRFQYKCEEIRETELKLIEKLAIERIAQNLLKSKL